MMYTTLVNTQTGRFCLVILIGQPAKLKAAQLSHIAIYSLNYLNP